MSTLKKLNRRMIAFLAIALCVSLCCDARADEPNKAKNVLLFIADGDGFNSEILGSYYHTGKPFGEVYHQFPVILGSATFAVHKHSNGVAEWSLTDDPEKNVGYVPKNFWEGPSGRNWRASNTEVTDSSASATAMNSGQKTLNGHVNYDVNGKRLENFADKNIKAGRSVGVVTTAQISHATPAGASAHNLSRGAYEEIGREQIDDLSLSVLMGSGHPDYNNGKAVDKAPDARNYQFVGGRELWEKVKADDGYKGWKFIDQRGQFAELAAATPDSGKEVAAKVLGIVRTTGDVPPVDGDVDNPALMAKEYTQEAVDAMPSLTEMTVGALNVLSQNDKGFYLMVEGGNIDHANHSANAKRSAYEHVGFAKAVEAAVEWVEKYSSWDETIMIVTADHETGLIWGDGTYIDENNNGKYDSKEDTFEDFMKIEKSKKGSIPDVQYLTGSHTNALVPFCAKGCGAELARDYIRGKDAKAAKFWNFSGEFIYNSDVFNVMSAASGIE